VDKEQEIKEQVNKEACRLCAECNHTTCTTPLPDPNHWICKAWLKKAKDSYHKSLPVKLELISDVIPSDMTNEINGLFLEFIANMIYCSDAVNKVEDFIRDRVKAQLAHDQQATQSLLQQERTKAAKDIFDWIENNYPLELWTNNYNYKELKAKYQEG